MEGDVNMTAICLREFKSLFKSVRSIIIIFILLGGTLGTAKLLSQFNSELKEFGLDNAYVAGLFFLLLVLGPLFVTSLSHDVINRETHSRTIRFLVTKLSRDKIVIAKFLGISFFWFICIFVSLLLLIPFSKTFYFFDLIVAFLFITYFIALSLLFSTVISKPGLSMFIGITLSIAFPILGFWGMLSKDLIVLKIFSYVTPYFYVGQEETFYVFFIPIWTLLFLITSVIINRRRDF